MNNTFSLTYSSKDDSFLLPEDNLMLIKGVMHSLRMLEILLKTSEYGNVAELSHTIAMHARQLEEAIGLVK